MKAVGNLTEFVRAHMLDTKPIKPRLEQLITHFDDLTRAHEAVIRAKRQVDLLTPIAEEGERHQAESELRALLDRCRQELRPHVGFRKIAFLQSELARLRTELAKAEQSLERTRAKRTAATERVASITADIAGSGGDELRRIASQIVELTSERDRRHAMAQSFATDAATTGVMVPQNEAEFVDMAAAVQQRRSVLEAQRQAHDERAADLAVELKELRTRHNELTAEIANLRSQRGNIPLNQIRLREQMGSQLSIPVSELPFAGELVQVAGGEDHWEGAAERLLHNFALSMLVPDPHYTRIQQWVDAQHLGQRLVYFRIPPRVRSRDEEVHRYALLHKLTIRDGLDPKINAWLDAELLARTNVVCCETVEQFVREPRAITVAGQIKGSNQRHEKDDRFRINDRSRFVLGWSNESKIAALELQQAKVEAEAQRTADLIARTNAERTSSNAVADALARIESREFRDIDWGSIAATISELERARDALLASSNRLRELEAQLVEAKRLEVAATSDVESERANVGVLSNKIVETQEEHDELAEEFAEHGVDTRIVTSDVEDRVQALILDVMPNAPTRLKHLSDAESAARERLTNEITAVDHRIKRLEAKLIGWMKDFNREFPAETQELDASLDAVHGYVEVLVGLRADDLPRFEAEFRNLLSENTLREIAGFQQALHQERTEIDERIDKINASLATIEYNRTRYIALVIDPTRDQEIRDFQTELRACTEGTLNMSEDPVFVEQKFLQVKALIERFRGRANYADADRRWTAKVTDVRNWFTFAASERLMADDSEYEHYSDSAGKSGGQKEKLAYTVLAASLAYQFGLELGETKSRSFRFVAIDEAFGRADTEATKFGLELFGKLHLQLLVVTPLQRISIIEPFVQRVGFVSVRDDRSSIANLTIEEYRRRRDRS